LQASPGANFYDWTFLAGDIFPVFSCLRRGKKRNTQNENYARPTDLRAYRRCARAIGLSGAKQRRRRLGFSSRPGSSQDAQELHQVAQVLFREFLRRPGLLLVLPHVTHRLVKGREAAIVEVRGGVGNDAQRGNLELSAS